jgi:hypothetical protein
VQIQFNAAGSGVMTAIGINDCGFASPVDYAVTVAASPEITIVTTPESNTLTASHTGTAANYQWYLNGNAIPGATGNVHEATESGNYTVEVIYDNDCTNISAVVNVVIVSVDPASDDPAIALMPVPAKNVVTIKGLSSETRYDIIDLHGRVVMTGIAFHAPLDVSFLAEGLYTMQLQHANTIVSKQLLIVK